MEANFTAGFEETRLGQALQRNSDGKEAALCAIFVPTLKDSKPSLASRVRDERSDKIVGSPLALLPAQNIILVS